MKKSSQFFVGVLLVAGILTAGMVLSLVSCLNPIGFNPELTLKVEIEGQIDARILNDAVIWVINRSKTVDVTEFEISRPPIPNEKNYQYPKRFDKPTRGTSHASYHLPTDAYYHIKIKWRDDHPSTPPDKRVGVYEKDFQFPRPYDYKFYLYRTKEGKTIVIDDDEMKELPDPGDTENPPEPPDPSQDSRHTFVVMNMTKSMDIDEVDLVKDGITYSIIGEPLRKDQQMYRLYAGSYKMTASYTANGVAKTTTQKNAIVVQEAGAQSLRSNYMYFYRTRSGGYELTPLWPPSDAADEENVNPEDVLDDSQGILEIQNNAVPNNPHSIIARIWIDGIEYPNANNSAPYMLPGSNNKSGDVERFVLPVGMAHVKFMPTDRVGYGMMIPRTIKSKKVTVLSYTNDLANPDVIPPSTGYGSGLIRVENRANGVVNTVALFDKNNLAVMRGVPYTQFDPPYPISYGNLTRIPVVGDAAFPLTAGGIQLIQITVMTKTGPVVIDKIAALYNNIVDIVITQSDIEVETRHDIGARITARNNTTTTSEIVNIEVYDMSVPGNKSLFTGDYWMPHGAITNGTEAVFDVISSPLMPITETEQFRAKLAVTVTRTSGVASGYVYKDFSPKTLYGELPGNTRAITLTESDITGIVPPPPIPQFVPVTDVLISSADIVKGTNTQLSWAVIPGDATNKDGYWTVYLSDSTYSITQGGSVWVSSSRSYDYLYVAHVIPNGIAEGTRNTTLHYVPEVGVAIYDGNKDFFKVFKLNVKTGSSGGTGGTGGGGTSYSTYILKDGGSTKIDKLVFRPTSGTFTDMYSYDGMNNRGLHMNPRSSGPVLANEYSSWTSADEQPGDIVITLTSIKNTGDQQTFDLPAGEYKVIAVQSNGYVKGCTANYWLNFSTESSFWNGKNGFYFRLCADSVAPQSGMSSEKLHLRAWMKP